MKIVHIITRLIIGGAQENTLLSCEGQHRFGHDVTLLTGPALGPEGSLMQRALAGGYRVEVVDSMRRAILPAADWRTYRALVRRLGEIAPDVVHTHSSKAGIIGRWAAAAANRRRAAADAGAAGEVDAAGRAALVHTIHGLAFTASTRRVVNEGYRLAERKTAPITDRIVCVADAMRDQSLAANIGRAEQYVTVYSGMETAPFLDPSEPRESVRRRLGLEPQHVAVGTIARLFHLKGHQDLLDLAPDLCRRFPQLRFLWVGDGLLRPVFEAQIRLLGLKDRFILAGLVQPGEIPALANAMDVLAHPSRREGLARALPQGQLCGCPCVTYDIDGAKEGVIEGKSGFVVPPFDRQRFGEAIATLVGDAERRRRMGEVGRRFALGRFDAGVMVEGLEKVYRIARNPNDQAPNPNQIPSSKSQ
jgi:glycosyltransferase involved in cell wall biosynthesis